MNYEFLFVTTESSWVIEYTGDSQEQALARGLKEDYSKSRLEEISKIYGIENDRFKSMAKVLNDILYSA